MYIHGGDIYKNKIEYDFSVNLNPNGLLEDIKKAIIASVDSVEAYPEYRGESLLTKLSEKLGVDDKRLVLTSGASEAFITIVRALDIDSATLFYPGFFGYEYALNSNNAVIQRVAVDELVCGGFDVSNCSSKAIFIANPNNPTGLHVKENILTKLVIDAQSRGIAVIIDECFLPLSDFERESFIYKDYDNVIVVRSFTKSFAMPGLRLGYVYSKNEELIEKIGELLPEWNLSNLAIEAGKEALNHIKSINDANELIAKERVYLTDNLNDLGLEVFDSETNFILFKGPENLYEMLLNKGILIRDCSNFYGLKKGFFRIAVREHNENQAFIDAMREINE